MSASSRNFRPSALLCALCASLLTASGSADAAIDLLGRTQATFSWRASAGEVVSYDVYVACADGRAPDGFDPSPSLSIPAATPSVSVTAGYGSQCQVRVVGRDRDGRISPVSLPSDVVRFIEPSLPGNDFDGDGFADIVVQDPSDGSTQLLSGADLGSGDGFLRQRTTVSTSASRDWQIVDTGDFNGDGVPDFLWFATFENPLSGATLYTYFVGSASHSAKAVLVDVTDTEEIIAVADFNGDGSDDILHRTNDRYGTVFVTFMGPAGVIRSSRYEGVLQGQFDFIASGDFDGDGNDDVMWRRRASGQTVVWLMTRPGRMTPANSGILPGDEWVGEAAGNFNNLAQADVLWRNLSSGETVVWYMDDLEQPEVYSLGAPMPAHWSLLAAGDMDGDGRADLTWLDETTSLLEIWRMDENQRNGFRVD